MSIVLGDCLDRLKEIKENSIDMVYLDPPFFTQRNHVSKTRDNSKEYMFEDCWDSIGDYIEFMKKRLIECHRVLKPTGSIFLHCDKSASHYLRVILDEVFGMNNFLSEIIWSYKRWSNSKKGLLNGHQTIYFYGKTKKYKFNTMYTDYSPTTNIDQILQDRERNEHGKCIYKRDKEGNVINGKEKKGVPLSDVWSIPYLNPKANERTGYPTQKPILLLEQIIKISTDEEDLILDPFCGSGTTLVASKLLNRKYIGIDISEEAVQLSTKRLESPVKTESFLLQKGEDDYIQKTEEEINILKSIDAIPVQRNNGIDGFLKNNHLDKPVAVKIQKQNETLNEAKDKLISAGRKKNCSLMILIRTNFLLQTQLGNSLENEDDNLVIIDSYNININNYLARSSFKPLKKEQQEYMGAEPKNAKCSNEDFVEEIAQ